MLEAALRQEPAGDPLLTLVETIEALSAARTIDQIAAVVRSSARRISGADGVAIVLLDEDQCLYVDEDAIGTLFKGRRFAKDACISGYAMTTGQTVVSPDIYQDPRIPQETYRDTFVKSLVMVPIRKEDPIGAIGAYWATPRRPVPDEVARLEVMARATASAVESARMQASLAQALERRRFLLRELDHRCKNTLAAVQSIADQTLRRSVSPEHFVEAFTGRLGALSRAHELLTRGQWGHASLAEVLEQVFAPFGGAAGGRIRVVGPAVALAPETSVAMHMTLHELAVNAAKYGALSVEAGWLSVEWTVETSAASPGLRLTWRELGGPLVREPETRGFGSRLIERGISRELNGRAEIEYLPEGVCFTLEAPLSPRLSLA